MKSKKAPSLLSVIVIVVLFIAYLIDKGNQPSNPPTPVPPTGGANSITSAPPTVDPNNPRPGLGQRTKTSGCTSANALPDFACTPGAVFPDVTTEQICTSGYSSSVRNVPDSVKNAVYAEYGITSHAPGQYEVDHDISLELGGSNDIANLWPEPAEPRPGFHEKDKVENYLHDQVCSGAMSLQEAQVKIATDWVSVYNSLP